MPDSMRATYSTNPDTPVAFTPMSDTPAITSNDHGSAICEIRYGLGVGYETLERLTGKSSRTWERWGNGGPSWREIVLLNNHAGRHTDLPLRVAGILGEALYCRSLMRPPVERPVMLAKELDLNHDGKVDGKDRIAALARAAHLASEEAGQVALSIGLKRHEHALAVVRELRSIAEQLEAQVAVEQGITAA